ncbi:arabinan endo-1,5-alpha-L-arabinosidase [Pontibacter sp. E15-1]|uniref:arabinan endo-1,5-alpha-L-arabinosidase n=1 Tax=Pontibacter sp. E15-1 TaxID=2919918 RepID=UPI001F4F620C|nr:arabinan endo-1,5-alpha-L-arabinosidase [Pontibacter sp. E15-1]MCJ8164400.1 arabinan endo-1,5-alpha-L-arabinosidase [Pontibacter sp. E15-1]
MMKKLRKAGIGHIWAMLHLCAVIALPSCAQTKQIPVHDPVMIRQDDSYFLFATGSGIAVWSSKNMKDWTREPAVFAEAPVWASSVAPDFKNHIWAPDITYHNGQYYLYYSVSAFGKNTSAIGVATNKTLHATDPAYTWVDHGIVVESVPGRDMWNAIDPNLVFDEKEQPWLSFGSFWSGLKIVKLRPDLLSVASENPEWHTIVQRERTALEETKAGEGAVEAPFIFRKGNYYYLFASFDYCCRGPESTYKMVVGRSENVTGPYMDKEGRKMVHGGGSLLLEGNKDWYGVGHNSVYNFDGQDYLVFHGYDAKDEGKSKLRIEKLAWDKKGWPVVSVPAPNGGKRK